MALIKCPECGKEISDAAKTCPHCGIATLHQNNERKSNLGHHLIGIGMVLASISYLVYVLSSK